MGRVIITYTPCIQLVDQQLQLSFDSKIYNLSNVIKGVVKLSQWLLCPPTYMLRYTSDVSILNISTVKYFRQLHKVQYLFPGRECLGWDSHFHCSSPHTLGPKPSESLWKRIVTRLVESAHITTAQITTFLCDSLFNHTHLSNYWVSATHYIVQEV